MKKLSPAQLQVLRALNEEGAMAYYRENRGRMFGGLPVGPGWILPKLGRAEINTMRVLFRKGYLSAPERGRATITPSGRAYLAELEKEDD